MAKVDERYKRAMIYTIRNYTDDTLIYVGSTINTLSKRFNGHKVSCKAGNNITLYSHIDNNDWTDWYIELYEAYSCNNKNELDRREGEVIREIGTINKCIPGRSKKEYREDNVDKIKEYKKEYLKENADKINESKKLYRENNKEKLKNHRTQKICCDICCAIISRHSKAKHQRTKTCLAIKNSNNTDIPSDSHIVDL